LDDDGSEIGDSSVGNVAWQKKPPSVEAFGMTDFWKRTNTAKSEEEIELVIRKGLPDLVRLEMLVLHARLVLSQSLHGHATMLQTEPLGRDGGVREEDEHDDSPCGAEGAAKREHQYEFERETGIATDMTKNSYFQDGKAPRT
jgi:hypothetical protein